MNNEDASQRMAHALELSVSGHTNEMHMKGNQVHVSVAPSLHSCDIHKILKELKSKNPEESWDHALVDGIFLTQHTGSVWQRCKCLYRIYGFMLFNDAGLSKDRRCHV